MAKAKIEVDLLHLPQVKGMLLERGLLRETIRHLIAVDCPDDPTGKCSDCVASVTEILGDVDERVAAFVKEAQSNGKHGSP